MFVLFVFLVRFRSKMNFLWTKLVLKIFLKWRVLPMFFKMVKSAMFCYVRVLFCVFCVFGKVLIENELFVGEVSFENLLNVIGFAYVFETGQKCCVLLFPCFFVFFCVLLQSCLRKNSTAFNLWRFWNGSAAGGGGLTLLSTLLDFLIFAPFIGLYMSSKWAASGILSQIQDFQTNA